MIGEEIKPMPANVKPPYLKINHDDIHLLIDILDELETKTSEEMELQAKLEEIYRRMRDAKEKKRQYTNV